MDLDHATPIITALAKEFMTAMLRIDPDWERAYWRFESSAKEYGSNASYVAASEVSLISALDESDLFDELNALGRELWQAESLGEKRFLVCLLIITADFDYEIKFEWEHADRWWITKLDGKSGLPEGI
jgi:hypothetical protein